MEIDDNWEEFITSGSDGSSTPDFRVTTGEHRFKFTNKDTNTEHSGTISVNPQQTRFILRIRNGGVCSLMLRWAALSQAGVTSILSLRR